MKVLQLFSGHSFLKGFFAVLKGAAHIDDRDMIIVLDYNVKGVQENHCREWSGRWKWSLGGQHW